MEIAVIGGGAAGFFAAINIAAKNPKAAITLFEAAHRPLQKVFISGGGRCNLTHACFDPKLLVQNYPRGQKALLSIFHRFQPKDTIAWFEQRGLKLKTEPDGRMFPVSDHSQDVIDLFLREAQRLGVQIHTRQPVCLLEPYKAGYRLGTTTGGTFTFDKVILATGYSPPGWKLAASLGHTIIPPVPSLFPFKVQAPVIQGLQGISLENIQGKLKVDKDTFQAEGDLLITHTGLSGPVIYRLSAKAAQVLAKAQYQGELILNLFPDWPEEALREHLTKQFQTTYGKKKLGNTKLDPLPHRLWLSLLAHSGANLEERGEVTGKKVINRLVNHLKSLALPVTGKSPSKEEFVSCGGVSLKEVNFKTMESTVRPGVYFAGEILDIDALTGGFNFQACWSEAWVISEALSNR